jgi:small subunit ribosomal protein S6
LRQYEAMFLFDPTFATDMNAVNTEIDRLMERSGGEIILSKKWEERRLAFEIKKRKRGCYVLAYFNAEPTAIVGIERDVTLSESVLRVLIVSAEGLSRSKMESHYVERPVYSDDDGRGDRRRPRPGSSGPTSPAESKETPKSDKPAEPTKPVETATTEAPAPVAVAETEPGDKSDDANKGDSE